MQAEEAAEFGEGSGMIVHAEVEIAVVLPAVAPAVAHDEQRGGLHAAFVAAGGLGGIERGEHTFGEGAGGFREGLRHAIHHCRAGEDIPLGGEVFARARAGPFHAPAAGEGGRRSLRREDARLTLRAPRVGGDERLEHLLRGLAFGEKRQAVRPPRGIGHALRRHGTDAGFGIRHDGTDAKDTRLHGHAEFAGRRIARDDRIGGHTRRSGIICDHGRHGAEVPGKNGGGEHGDAKKEKAFHGSKNLRSDARSAAAGNGNRSAILRRARLDAPRVPSQTARPRRSGILFPTLHRTLCPHPMNLRDQLKEILPALLPANPAAAIKGTDLIGLAKAKLRQEYSDATLRYHFTIMCSDPGSPIAKVEQGQGYYLRRHSGSGAAPSMTQARLNMFTETDSEVLGRAGVRLQKLRAVIARDAATAGRFPFLFESSFASGASLDNVWKCPDAVELDWESGEFAGEALNLDAAEMDLKRSLGVPPCTLSGVKFKLEINTHTWREDFYQALSATRWAHTGELVIAAAIEDAQLADELRRLGTAHGLGIVTCGLDLEMLDDLRPAWQIPEMTAREFDALQQRFVRQRLTTAQPRPLDWRVVRQLRSENPEFGDLFRWLQHSLAGSRALPWEEFAKLETRLAGDGD